MKDLSITDNATQAVAKINENFAERAIAAAGVNTQDVFLGYLEQNGNWVRQTCIVAAVAKGITYHFALPDAVVAKVEYGADNTLGSTSANISNGETLTLPTSAKANRISFARYTNGSVASLSVADATQMIADGKIRVYVDDADIITHNIAKEPMLRALAKLLNSGAASAAPLIAHISDTHGDAQRVKRFFDFCMRYGIDECVASGDIVMENHSDGSDYLFAAAEDTGCHVLMAIGNHEAEYTNSTLQIPNPSADENYGNHFAGHVADMGYHLNGDSDTTNRGYYYHDVPTKSLRFIVLDQYDGGVYGGGATTPSNGNMPKTQLEWFIATLKSTPAGYGVIVVMHSPENTIEGENKFFTTVPLSGSDSYSYANNGFYSDAKRPISKIIDAFISRSSFTDSFTVKVGGSSTGTITADFTSGVADGVEFICYLHGHRHQDRVGYLKKDTSGASLANNQLSINIVKGNAFGGFEDLPRYGVGVTQDAFNVYAIDRANKQVRIMRIGSNVKKDLTMRDYMVISYAPSNS